MSWLFELDKVNDWAYWDNAFSDDELKKIIKLNLFIYSDLLFVSLVEVSSLFLIISFVAGS